MVVAVSMLVETFTSGQ